MKLRADAAAAGKEEAEMAAERVRQLEDALRRKDDEVCACARVHLLLSCCVCVCVCV